MVIRVAGPHPPFRLLDGRCQRPPDTGFLDKHVLGTDGCQHPLAALNPKNMMMSVAAATTISSASMGLGTATIAIVVFVVLAVLSVLVPVVSYLVAPAKATHILEAMRTWLTVNNGTIMAVLFVILGVQLLGKGIGSF